MDLSNQTQKAGDNAQQVQIGNNCNVNLTLGISEERVRAVFSEMIVQALEKYTEVAHATAYERIQKLEEYFIPILKRHEENLSFIADPGFQKVLRDAQIEAATTDRDQDYNLLAELLARHIEKGDDRKTKTGIRKAIKIIGEIDNDALCALSVAYTTSYLEVHAGVIKEGMQFLDDIFSKLIYLDLPSGNDWLDHLDILGVMRFSPFTPLRNFVDFYSRKYDGYFCVGILKDSKEYRTALNLLDSVGISQAYLVEHELLENYVRISISTTRDIDALNASNDQKETIRKIFELYSTDGDKLAKVKENFLNSLNKFSSLQKVQRWWDKIPSYLEFTQVGKVLAAINIKRLDPTLPEIEF